MSNKDFMLGFNIGTLLARQRAKRVPVEPDAPIAASQYLYGTPAPTVVTYNGAELPDIESVWELLAADQGVTEEEAKAYLPYAVAYRTISTGVYSLTLTSNKPYADGGYIYLPSETIRFEFYAEGNEWVFVGGHTFGGAILDENYGEVTWSNHDILNIDGTTYLAASDPVYTQTGGNIGLRVGDTVTLYDGAVLPKMPEHDKNTHPNVYIYKGTLFTGGVCYHLHLTTNDPYYAVSDSGDWCIGRRNGDISYWWYDGLSDAFEYRTDWTNNGVMSAMHNLVWSNFDVLNEDGSVYLQGTDPIPVGDVVDTINNIPIYEDLR